MGEGSILIPGKEPYAVIEFVQKNVSAEILGQKPATVRAWVTGGTPLLIDMGVSK